MEAYKTEWYGSKAKVLRRFRDMQVIDYGCRGKGIITDIRLFPGIQLSLQDMDTEVVFPAQTFSDDIVSINYCVDGRQESEFRDNTIAYLLQHHLSVIGTKFLPVSFSFPLRKYRGISLVLEQGAMDAGTFKILNTFGVDPGQIEEHLHLEEKWFISHPMKGLDHLFREILQVTSFDGSRFELHRLRLKVIELLQYISQIPFAFMIIWASKKRQKKLFEKQVQEKLTASDRIQEYLEGMKVVRSCNMAGESFENLKQVLTRLKKISVKVELAVGVFMSSASMVLQAGIGITVFVGCRLLIQGKVELLTLLMFLLMATRMYGPILAILGQLSSLLNLDVVTKRMRMLLNAPKMSGNRPCTTGGSICLEHVSFGYNEEETIKDVSLTIRPGETVAIVGPSGSGKSTLTKLIARFWDVSERRITYGGDDIRQLAPGGLMKNFSFVFQDVTLFQDTILNNIRIGKENATDEEVLAAAKKAFCDEFVSRLPDGYETVLGENGGTLSGGERQRISIARAILKDAPVIILDEATASLDPENEVFVQQAIANLSENKTVIMIAHRLRTITGADQIFVLEQGRVKESGTHAELLEQKGLYNKLFRLQNSMAG